MPTGVYERTAASRSTTSEALRRAWAEGRSRPQPRSATCSRGHDDWYMRLDGDRYCRTCQRERLGSELAEKTVQPRIRTDRVGYRAAHTRHRALLAGQPCAHQDESCSTGEKIEVALRHDTNPWHLLGGVGQCSGLHFSLDAGDYLPLCAYHHRRYDACSSLLVVA